MCKWLEKIVVGHEKGTMHSGSDIEDYDEEDDASSSSSSSSVDRDEEMMACLYYLNEQASDIRRNCRTGKSATHREK